ncbi:MAG TPA: hypothetical protein VKB70_08630 [Gaiellaceae bacterium]|nr:hypothetical protein [Gaiellaceae bacterium]
MKRLALALVLVVLAIPAASQAAACSPLNCSPSQFLLGHGTLLGVRKAPDAPLRVVDLRTGQTRWRLPGGIVTGDTLVGQSPGLLTWYDTTTGERLHDAPLQLHGVFQLVGTSQDAKRAVLARTQTRSTTFAIVSPGAQRIVKLGGGDWQFDALNGSNLILIQQLRFGYEVRLYDLASNTLQPAALKDPRESALIQGIPFARASSASGRYLFTLYVGSDGGAMIHELDTVAGKAHCIDLPGNGDFSAAITWALVPGGEGTLWAVSVGYGRIVRVDVAAHAVRRTATFNRATWTSNAGVAALARDGTRIVVTDAQHIWLVSLKTLTVRAAPSHTAIAVAFSTDGRRVIGIGQRSSVFAIRA